MTSADVSCRVAWSDDAPAIARVQARAWRSAYVGVLPDALLDQLDLEEVTEGWREALVRPDDARRRVLVALERSTVTGFALTGPAADPDCDPVADGELADLTVDPSHQRVGHGTRLVQACVDTLVADRFTRAVCWVNAADDAVRALLGEGGWAPDGAHRELDLRGDGEIRVKQVRLHTGIG